VGGKLALGALGRLVLEHHAERPLRQAPQLARGVVGDLRGAVVGHVTTQTPRTVAASTSIVSTPTP
jgi:hypothetical protein